MGLRRLRARLDGLEAHGHATMNDYQLLAGVLRDLVDDIQDGFGISIHIGPGAAKSLTSILMGRAGELPITVSVDPEFDTKPPREVKFVGGPYDGQTMLIPEKYRDRTELTLEKGHSQYRFDGKVFRYVD